MKFFDFKDLMPADVEARRVISLEEEIQANVELVEASHGIDAVADETEHAINVSDALTQLADVAATISEPTPVEQKLIEIVGQAGAAGTGVKPSTLVPSLEEAGDSKSLGQRARETVKKIWQAILNGLKRLGGWLTSFFKAGPVAEKAKIDRIDSKFDSFKTTAAESEEKLSRQVSSANDTAAARIMKEHRAKLNKKLDELAVVEVKIQVADFVPEVLDRPALLKILAPTDVVLEQIERSADAVLDFLEQTIDSLIKRHTAKMDEEFRFPAGTLLSPSTRPHEMEEVGGDGPIKRFYQGWDFKDLGLKADAYTYVGTPSKIAISHVPDSLSAIMTPVSVKNQSPAISDRKIRVKLKNPDTASKSFSAERWDEQKKATDSIHQRVVKLTNKGDGYVKTIMGSESDERDGDFAKALTAVVQQVIRTASQFSMSLAAVSNSRMYALNTVDRILNGAKDVMDREINDFADSLKAA